MAAVVLVLVGSCRWLGFRLGTSGNDRETHLDLYWLGWRVASRRIT